MMTEHNNINFYQAQADAVGVRIGRQKARSRAYMAGNIASFMAAVGCIVLLTLTVTAWKQALEAVFATAFFALYLFIRMRDARNDEAIHH
ncbi:MAG: hypothetical protein ACFNMD_02930, partial [Prevotella sp.]